MSPATESIVIRYSYPDDAAPLARLAALDSTRLPLDSYLVAEVDGEIIAVRGVRTGAVAADPFRPTGDVLALLDLRARRLAPRRARGRRRWGALRTAPAR